MMDPTVISAILALVGSLVGTFGGIIASSKLTEYRIDIKSESRAKAAGDFDDLYLDDYDENGEYIEGGQDLILEEPEPAPKEDSAYGQELIADEKTPAENLSGVPGNEG